MLNEHHLAEFGRILDRIPAFQLVEYLRAMQRWMPKLPFEDDFCPYTLYGELFLPLEHDSYYVPALKFFGLDPLDRKLTSLENAFWDHWLMNTSPIPDIQQLLTYARERSAGGQKQTIG